MQKLIMPFKKCMMLCGYKNAEYQKYWKYPHYGVDISTIQGKAGTDHTIYSSGNGTVLAVDRDNSLGYGIAILYEDCYNHHTGENYSVIARYMHMNEVFVSKGQKLATGEKIAIEGKEGTGDYHLHLEFDVDTKYPTYSPQVSSGHSFWKKGTDSTVNPSYLFHIGDNQEVVKPTYNPAWLNKEDFVIPKIEEINYKSLYEADHAKLEKIKEILGGI
jgi:murein DD-endopeptidase MepM/ murein hydrolase activator NlpD